MRKPYPRFIEFKKSIRFGTPQKSATTDPTGGIDNGPGTVQASHTNVLTQDTEEMDDGLDDESGVFTSSPNSAVEKIVAAKISTLTTGAPPPCPGSLSSHVESRVPVDDEETYTRCAVAAPPTSPGLSTAAPRSLPSVRSSETQGECHFCTTQSDFYHRFCSTCLLEFQGVLSRTMQEIAAQHGHKEPLSRRHRYSIPPGLLESASVVSKRFEEDIQSLTRKLDLCYNALDASQEDCNFSNCTILRCPHKHCHFAKKVTKEELKVQFLLILDERLKDKNVYAINTEYLQLPKGWRRDSCFKKVKEHALVCPMRDLHDESGTRLPTKEELEKADEKTRTHIVAYAKIPTFFHNEDFIHESLLTAAKEDDAYLEGMRAVCKDIQEAASRRLTPSDCRWQIAAKDDRYMEEVQSPHVLTEKKRKAHSAEGVLIRKYKLLLDTTRKMRVPPNKMKCGEYS